MSFLRKVSDPPAFFPVFPTYLIPSLPFRRKSRQSSTDSNESTDSTTSNTSAQSSLSIEPIHTESDADSDSLLPILLHSRTPRRQIPPRPQLPHPMRKVFDRPMPHLSNHKQRLHGPPRSCIPRPRDNKPPPHRDHRLTQHIPEQVHRTKPGHGTARRKRHQLCHMWKYTRLEIRRSQRREPEI